MGDMDCPICLSKFNKSTRRKIICDKPDCKQECCMSCFTRWTLDTDNDNANCMYCSSVFTQTQLNDKVSYSLVNKIFNHRAVMLCSREKSLLASTQPDVIAYKKDKVYEKHITELNKINSDLQEQIIKNKRKIRQLKSEMGKTPVVKAVFNHPCPDNDCKGFVSSSWKCGLCEKKFCKDCHKEKLEGHECNEDDKATIALIKQECKNCPQCGMGIYKIEGCDQMYCTDCHTPFSWRTGKIITNGPIHNPHYFEIMRRGGGNVPRQPGDVPCGGIPDHYVISSLCRKLKISKYNTDIILNCLRIIIHINNVVIPHFPLEQNAQTNKDFRIKYCINELDENNWIKKLKCSIKKIDKNNEIVAVLQCISVSLTDVIQRFCNDKGVTDIIKELDMLQNYANEQFILISKRYKNTAINIDKNWYTVYLGKSTIGGYVRRPRRVNGYW
jgi:hypothetical protein